MKTVGIIGGMSWESSADYYKKINQMVNQKLGGLNSAQVILHSVNFDPIERFQSNAQWEKAEKVLSKAAVGLEKAGADFIAIATNTMHKLAKEIQGQIEVPLIHIAQETGREIQKRGLKKVLLLGTKFTMEQDFYTKILAEEFELDVQIPNSKQRDEVHRIIFEELCLGKVLENSQGFFLNMIEEYKAHDIEGVILGCTEIQMIVPDNLIGIEVLDTTTIHCRGIVDKLLD